MAARDEIHRLLDGVAEERVAVISEIIRVALEAGLTGDQARQLVQQLRAYPDLTRLVAEPVRGSPVQAHSRPNLIWRSGSRKFCTPSHPERPRDPASGHVLQRLRRHRGHESKGRGRIVHLDQHDKGLRQ
jgi:hypothetical protein